MFISQLPNMSLFGSNNKLPIGFGALIVVLVIIDLLMTRRIIPYDNESGFVMFVLTTFLGYGVGSLILLIYANDASKELRTKTRLNNFIHWSVIIIQVSLFVSLVLILLVGNFDYYLSRYIFAISSIFATVIMGFIGYKFFSWYRASKFKNSIVFFYGLAAVMLGMSIIEDAGTKLLMINLIQDPELNVKPDGSSFIYEMSEKYNGEIVFEETRNGITTSFVIPVYYMELYDTLNSVILPIGFVFRWVASTMLLSNIYKKIGKLPAPLWVILSLPLVLYLLGKYGFSYGDFLLEMNEILEHYFRILFRMGTIAGNILFGLAFFVVARKLKNSKLKRYLILAGIGDTIVGISLSTSAIEPTFGVAAHSLVLLSTYLFALGLQASAIYISQELKLRQFIRDSAIEESKLLVSIGSAQIIKELEEKVILFVEKQKEELAKETGVIPQFTDIDTREYLRIVLKDIKILQNIDDIINKSKTILDQSDGLVVCSMPAGLRFAFNNYFDVYEKVVQKKKLDNHRGIKIVTSLNDKNDIELIKNFINAGIDVRHVKNIPPINFVASDREMIATIQKTESGQLIQNLLTTNEPAYIEHFVSIFDDLWNNGIDINQKICEFEQGIENQVIDIIQNPEVFEKLLFNLLKSAKEEAVGIFSTSRAYHRQEYSGSFKILKERIDLVGIKVRILVPEDEQIKNTIKELNESSLSNNIKIRIIEPSMQTKVSILVIDKTHSITVEVKDDLKKTTKEAIGFATYSNSKSTVLSYYSIFESLWKQIELYEQLQVNERMHNEFINIAAHELRTPIQPILGASDLLKKTVAGDRERELISIINRNAKRLKKLSEDILDVTKIEGYSLNINKETFKLIDIIVENINSYKINMGNKNIKFEYHVNEDVLLYADKNGISRVISNLINNSIKFIPKEKDGLITLIAEKEVIYLNKKPYQERILVRVKDNGVGIDEEVFPKLFTKFASKSYHGIGLGLYISKSVIEAHGGHIWAQNNEDGQGATFFFSLIKNLKNNSVHPLGLENHRNDIPF